MAAAAVRPTARPAAGRTPRAWATRSKRARGRCAKSSEVVASPGVAGVELASTAVRVVVGHRESGRFRVTGVGHAPLPMGAVSGGYVADRRAVVAALVAAFAGAERSARAEKVVVAIDGDDIRTYHESTTFEREDQRDAVSPGEAVKAIRLAREAAARAARDLSGDDPALRGIATAELRDDVGGFVLDGRRLGSPVGDRGQRLEVRTDIALAPLVQAGGATAALEAARRRGTATSGVYALSRLVAESGVSEAGIVRIGADVTAVAVVRDGRVTGTRVFAGGRETSSRRGTARPTPMSGRVAWSRPCVRSAWSCPASGTPADPRRPRRTAARPSAAWLAASAVAPSRSRRCARASCRASSRTRRCPPTISWRRAPQRSAPRPTGEPDGHRSRRPRDDPGRLRAHRDIVFRCPGRVGRRCGCAVRAQRGLPRGRAAGRWPAAPGRRFERSPGALHRRIGPPPGVRVARLARARGARSPPSASGRRAVPRSRGGRPSWPPTVARRSPPHGRHRGERDGRRGPPVGPGCAVRDGDRRRGGGPDAEHHVDPARGGRRRHERAAAQRDDQREGDRHRDRHPQRRHQRRPARCGSRTRRRTTSRSRRGPWSRRRTGADRVQFATAETKTLPRSIILGITLASGQIDIGVEAVVGGPAGNIGANRIVVSNRGVYTVTNPCRPRVATRRRSPSSRPRTTPRRRRRRASIARSRTPRTTRSFAGRRRSPVTRSSMSARRRSPRRVRSRTWWVKRWPRSTSR